MDALQTPLTPHLVLLEPGAQVVINGALVTATERCMFEVSPGAFVLTGAGLRREREALHHPHEELYFSMLDAGRSAEMFAEARPRLFTLLAQVSAHSPDEAGQRECGVCAAAMMGGDARAAIASAARLASERFEQTAVPEPADAGPDADQYPPGDGAPATALRTRRLRGLRGPP